MTDDDLYIGDIIHKAKIEVDELGSKAAAATSDSMVYKSLIVYTSNFWNFNRPFLFVIMDKRHRIPLFIGRVVDPTGKYQLKPRPTSSTTSTSTSTTTTTVTTATTSATSSRVSNCLTNGHCNGQDSLTISWFMVGIILILPILAFEFQN